jgi:di/tricarboxylate transporter
VPVGSALNGKSLAESTLRERYNLTVVAIERNGQVTLSPPPNKTVLQGDVILFAGNLDELRQRDVEPFFEILPSRDWREQDLESAAIVVVETVLAPRSSLFGQTLRQAHFREKYGMTVLALWRGGRQRRTGLADLPLQFGDALLLQGPRERLQVLQTEPDLIVLGNGQEEARLIPDKGRLALIIMVATLALATINSTLVAEVMLGGALLMVLVKVLSMDQAYQAVEWKSIFLIAGMLPLGIAITKTGAADLLAQWLITFLGPAGPLALLGGLFILTTLLTQAMNGAAVAAIMAPIAIQTAQNLGIDPRSLAMGVALATSMAFITPLGHAVNILVMGPGGYRFQDYFRVGLPLTLLLFAVIIFLLPLFWPLEY